VSEHPRRVALTRRAGKELRHLDRQAQRRILAALARLTSEDPSLDIKRLTGSEQSRVRVGDMRVIFQIDREANEVVIHRIAPRGRAYDR
jgi:mRNA-degrading endonuclease RelE of RelBE toxin-antitoxin system